jgi:hypothetical protein
MIERTYVLVHGGFHGGWCYARVAKILRAAGHQVLGAAADRIPDRIAALVYLDATIPVNNMAMLDTVEPSDIPAIVRSTGEHGGYLVPSFPAAAFGVNEADVALVNSLVTPQPLGTLTERITLRRVYGGPEEGVCTRCKAPTHATVL